jgi:murein DD-endopeptidase MepM/ murein hydrolase activator NlpD
MRTEIIEVRVFVEGIRVPFVNQVQVQTYASEAASATFSLPPIVGFETEELKRARVHIFWSDIETRAGSDDDDWPLLFEGEIVADGYSKSPTGRNQVFHCAGYHTYWEQVLLYYWDNSHPNPAQAPWAQKLAVSLGNERFEFDGSNAGVNFRQRMITALEENPDVAYQSIVKKVFGSAMDVNYFYQQANALLALDKRFVTPKDENIEVLLNRAKFKESLGKDIMSTGGHQSMMDVLKSVLEVFRYQIINNSQPSVIDVAEVERKTLAQRELDEESVTNDFEAFLLTLGYSPTAKTLSSTSVQTIMGKFSAGFSDRDLIIIPDEILKELGYPESPDPVTDAERASIEARFVSSAADLKTATNVTAEGGSKLDDGSDFEDLLAQFLILPETEFALPPTCNVIFPQDQTGFNLDRQLLQEPTRGISTPGTEAGQNFALLLAPPELSRAVIPKQPVQPANTNGFASPVPGTVRISSRFNLKGRNLKNRHLNPKGKSRSHKGIDLAVGVGTDVFSVDDGTVVRAAWQGGDDKFHVKTVKGKKKTFHGHGWGLHIKVRHPNGLLTVYAHLSALNVQKGMKVKAGQKIGESGNTGSSGGPHLHFETLVGGSHKNPETFLTLSGDGKSIVEAPKPIQAEETEPVEVEEENILNATPDADSEDASFKDWQYLTEEEQLTGIVPYFDLNTDRAHAFMAFGGAGEDSNRHLLQMLNSKYQLRRYQTRSLSALSGPFNPNPIAGFPGLVIDRVRSLIGKVASVSHSISVGGGQGNASTTTQIESPRYWDEGDPYYWVDGKTDFQTVEGKKVPSAKGVMPSYYLTDLIGVNSSDEDFWWDEEIRQWDFEKRPVDELYQQLLGPDVKGIPYQATTRDTNRSTRISFNKAIDSRLSSIDIARANKDSNWRGRDNNINTITGRYYYLVAQGRDGEEAEKFVRNFTKRRGVTERYLMTIVLSATSSNNGFSYGGGPFRAVYQKTILRLNEILGQTQQFRG